jgi:hypothetical protein
MSWLKLRHSSNADVKVSQFDTSHPLRSWLKAVEVLRILSIVEKLFVQRANGGALKLLDENIKSLKIVAVGGGWSKAVHDTGNKEKNRLIPVYSVFSPHLVTSVHLVLPLLPNAIVICRLTLVNTRHV